MEFYISVVVVLILAVLMFRYINACRHQWVLLETYGIYRVRDETQIGIQKIYECRSCKKMKTEKSELS